MRIIDGIPIFGTEVDEGALAQIKNCAKTADRCALMADHHKGYAVPIGGVVAYRDAISPSGVGYDIGCGNKAVRLDCDVEDVKARISTIMDDVYRNISFGIGRKNAEDVDHPLFESPIWTLPAISELKDLAHDQLGTVGSGNHYVDIFIDEQNRVWIGVHFGSRGFGHRTATFFLNAAGAKDGMDVDPCVIPWKSDLGSDYILAMQLAGQYAYAGRDWVCNRVAQMLGGTIVEEVHNHHNFAWHEEQSNHEWMWVVRKGATPAFPGQKGFIGGSMAENAVIVEGVEDGSNEYTLSSTIHGAGRIMGRREAAGKTKDIAKWRCSDYRKCDYTAAKGGYFKEEGGPTPKCPICGHKLRLETMTQILRPGKVTQEMMDAWVNGANVELRGAGLDESPNCYKRLPEVLIAQGSGIRVLHTLKPIGVAMAGKDIHDPYKD
jgi:tRNA-splicing ligase RtcB